MRYGEKRTETGEYTRNFITQEIRTERHVDKQINSHRPGDKLMLLEQQEN